MPVNNQRQTARKFVEYWTSQRGSEKGEDQRFWNMLLREVLGMEDVERRTQPQVPVQMKGTTKFLDLWIPETKVLVEHKSRGIRLDAPQAGHGGKTPYEQALEYNQARGYSDKARWIVTCNFDEIWVYDMDRPLAGPQKIRLGDLPKEVSRLKFLVDDSVKSVREKEKGISIQAGRIVGELYRELLKRYAAPDSPETLRHLNRLCVRLVFLFYAEDAEIFPKDAFWNLLKETPAKFLRGQLMKLFRVLDTPGAKRDPYLEPELSAFPYTNGGLFKGAHESEIPPLDDEIKALLVKSSDFDWREISPTIFGALFESTLNPVTRRAGGMVYTSVENIHKVIAPLFLDDLTRRVDELVKQTDLLAPDGVREMGGRPSPAAAAARGEIRVLNKKERAALLALQDEMASLTFLDPACGSGNFLTETFLSLRRLENRIIAALQQGQGELDLGISTKVSLAQFFGLEINDFAVAVAKTALWIAEAQMLQETAQILHREPNFLPLRDYDGIVEGNALRMDWPHTDYIMGNPPFVGLSFRTKEQAADMDAVYADWKDTNYGKLDYVCAWYKKAVDCILATKNTKRTKVAFVSTNSICQGECVAAMWEPMFSRANAEIDFAWRTFRWDNETIASEKAHVHCVIVGFHIGVQSPTAANKLIFVPDPKDVKKPPTIIKADHINGYLLNADDVFMRNRGTPPDGFPKLVQGSKPWDGGNLILSIEERDALLASNPDAESFSKRYLGAEDLIKNKLRYCLWLLDVSPAKYRGMPEIMRRLAAVAEIRRKTKTVAVQKQADTPYLFSQIRQPETDYLVVPETSSGARHYIPVGFMPKDVIASNSVMTMANATPYLFGVLSSSVHSFWMRTVAGRLKSDYRYTPSVYNNFPWPDLCDSASLRETISQTAQAILDARARYPDSSLADLYDPLTMPPDLRAAHEANDRAVLAAYGLAPDTPEPEIVAHLFGLYAKATNEAKRTEETKGTKVTEATRETREISQSLKSLQSLSSFEGGANG